MKFFSKGYGWVSLSLGRYPGTDALAIQLFQVGDPELLAVLSVNLPEFKHLLESPSETFIKVYSENAELAAEAFAAGLFEDTGKKVSSGYVTIPIWRLKDAT